MNIVEYKKRLHSLLGKEVFGVIDRPLGSTHPKHKNIIYKVNYGYIEDFLAPDEEEQDAYVLGIDKPIKTFKGRVIAIIERIDDNEDKLVVSVGQDYSKEEIEELVNFQEQYFKHHIITIS